MLLYVDSHYASPYAMSVFVAFHAHTALGIVPVELVDDGDVAPPASIRSSAS